MHKHTVGELAALDGKMQVVARAIAGVVGNTHRLAFIALAEGVDYEAVGIRELVGVLELDNDFEVLTEAVSAFVALTIEGGEPGGEDIAVALGSVGELGFEVPTVVSDQSKTLVEWFVSAETLG